MNINQLEEYFNSIDLLESIQLDQCTFVGNVKQLIDSNLLYLRSHPGNKRFMPYYNQLLQLKDKIEQS